MSISIDDDYFLSAENPVANVDQRDLEARALALMESPQLQQARAIIAQLWRGAVAYPYRDQMAEFDNVVTELLFWHAQYAANGDAGHPRVFRVMEPPIRSFGRDIPGARWGADCPDFIYRMIPVEHGGRYEVRAAPSCANSPLTTYTLMGASMSPPANIKVLDSREARVNDDGELVLTIDATASGDSNHLQSKPGAHHLLIRDAMGDWQNQSPSRLRVTRLDKPSYGPRSDDDLANEALRRAMEGFFFAFYIMCSGNGHAPNIMSSPHSSGASGGMPSQWSSTGVAEVKDDEALIITVTSAGAQYRNVQLNDVFSRSINYWDRTGAFNMTQMRPDADGRFTYVVAHEDPGVHNWLDTGGRKQTLVGHRWQQFEGGALKDPPVVETRLVKFKDLAGALPSGVTPISPADRKTQLAERLAGFERRLIGR